MCFSLRRFFLVPTTYVLVEKEESYFFGTNSELKAWNQSEATQGLIGAVILQIQGFNRTFL